MSANNQPGGDTPIAAALERYTQWMAGQAGERHLIIVTDGVESCMRFGRLLERAQGSPNGYQSSCDRFCGLDT